MTYRCALVCLTLGLACSQTLGAGVDGAAAPDGSNGPSDAADGGDAGAPTVEGRVLVVQQSGSSSPEVWSRAWFAWANPCRIFSPTVYNCSCTDSETAGCSTRTCGGFWGYLSAHPLLGYDPGDGLQTTATAADSRQVLDAGALQTSNGATAFTHGSPYDAHDVLPAPWQAGATIGISAAGAEVPAFSVEVPFPAAVTFLQPDLGKGKIAFDSDTLDIKWTVAAEGPGSVEATIAELFQPDHTFNFTVTRCTAPVDQGEMLVPVPSLGAGNAWRGLAVRVLDRSTLQMSGLKVDALVASFDSGPLDDINASIPAGGL
jgi:hypothetical protein